MEYKISDRDTEDPSGRIQVTGATTITASGKLYQTLVEDNEMEVVHFDGEKPRSSNKRKGGLFGLFSDIRVFAVVVCLYIMFFVMVEMYIVAVITTIEKRFGFRSSSSGMLLSIKEIAYVCVVALSSHFGNRWHRPRFLSLMAVLGAFGSALSSLPHFLYDSPFHVSLNSTDVTIGSKTKHLCQSGALEFPLAAASGNTSQPIGECTGGDNQQVAHNDGAYAIFAASSVVVGLAIAPMIACTTTYVDDAVGPVKNALYLAFMNMMRPLGPVLAFLVGGLFTSFHESLEDPGYGPSDPRWVGAWWVGYLINPSLLLIAAILIALFPKTMPKDWIKKEAIEMTIHTQIEKKEKENVITDLFRALGRLLCNPTYMALMASGCFSSFVVSGMFPFMPKYIEVQFHLSASKANVLVGIVGSLLAGVGVLLGGVLSSRLKLKPSQSACFILVTDILFIVAVLLMMSITCPSVTYVGINNPTNETCSATCGCEMNQFDPVCGSDGLTYTSPCMAGCQQYNSNETLGDCTCIGGAHTAVPGPCDSGCRMWMLYMAVLAGGAVIGMMASVPATTICLRCVEERDRSLALGFTGTVISLISFVPGPLVYGLLIDSSCVLWADSCAHTGYCRIYNNDQFRFRLHGITAILKGVAGLFYLLVWVLIRREEKKLTFTKVMTKEVHAVEKLSDESSESL